ncbi:FkbM family methyltransferase [Pedobacter sp. PF22-3]|uniref:FkbM family methyltransferase n=1 Tax=Pedobacter sp. PF22-3 TaxID=2994467 RepID=UPI002245CAE5|nr:FkbM family methyltransferase [Pedobacter sp. PF22-3]MCX2494202.1 FkbM family methyltransferase [Pedobacter sp. PF22-3]
MIKAIKKVLLKYLPVNYFAYSKSYSQDGEDMILKAIYEQKKGYKGFFVDVGAHHPVRYSNTNYFYKRGWKGINIEPTPSAIGAFNTFRKRDINLNIGIGPEKTQLKFYCFNEPALNSFSEEVSKRIDAESGKYKIIKELDIDVLPLSDVLDQYLPANTTIDFLSIDVEGLDYQVLLSNNWDKYKPGVILVEENVNVDELNHSPIYKFLKEKGYTFFAKTLRTCVYRL